MNVSFKVKIFDSKGTQVLPVAKSTLTIGSAPHCDVVLAHSSVSAEHARAWMEGGCIWVQDLGTSPGTSLNDNRLPPLKPMLIRDLDVLRLGQSDATLGLEAILVRAPVVKAKPVATAIETTDPLRSESKVTVRPVEVDKRREELETLGRELADVRLQLQMAKLDKQSAEELTQQLQNLRQEIKGVQGQKEKWDESLRQIEQEKQVMRKNVENELGEFKSKSRNELKEQRESDAKKFESWKREAAMELEKQARQLSVQKNRRWLAQMVIPELFTEIEMDMNYMFKRILLGEKAAAPAYAELPNTAPMTAPMMAPQAEPVSTSDLDDDIGNDKTVVAVMSRSGSFVDPAAPTEFRASTGVRKKRRTQTANANWRSVTIASLAVGIVMVCIWLGTDYYFKHHGSKNLSSQMPAPVPASVPAPRVESRAPARFEPKQTNKYRSSYTDNVLYLENYLAAESNPDFRRRWSAELAKVASSEWKLSQWSAAPVLAKEDALIRDLGHLRDGVNPKQEQEGISKMRSREAQFLKDLEASLKNRAMVDRFLKFKRSFYLRNQAYLTPVTQ